MQQPLWCRADGNWTPVSRIFQISLLRYQRSSLVHERVEDKDVREAIVGGDEALSVLLRVDSTGHLGYEGSLEEPLYARPDGDGSSVRDLFPVFAPFGYQGWDFVSTDTIRSDK